MNYSEILTTSWTKLWQEKVLLFFGLIPILPMMIVFMVLNIGALLTTEQQWNNFLYTFEQPEAPIGLLVFIGVMILSVIATWLLIPLCWGAISKGIIQTEMGQTGLTFQQLLSDTTPYYGRLLKVVLTIWFGFAAAWLLFMFFILGLGIVTMGIAFLCTIPLMFLLFPVMLIVFALLYMGIAAVPADDLSRSETLSKVWALIKTHFWRLMLMSFILYLIQVVLSMLTSTPIMIVQSFLPFLLQAEGASNFIVFRLSLGLMMVVMLFSFLATVFVMTYNQIAWTITYLRLTRDPYPAVPEMFQEQA